MSQKPIQRPTILISYGEYGLKVLKRLLNNTAIRGILQWDQGSVSNENTIHNLQLLWIKGGVGCDTNAIRRIEGNEQGQPDMIRELNRQIIPVEIDGAEGENITALPNATMDATEKLLDSRHSNNNKPNGLDIIVVGQLSTTAQMGEFTRLLTTMMDKLATTYPHMFNQQSGTISLNGIQILDFENYWKLEDKASESSLLRKALHGSVNQWQTRLQDNTATFGKIYLSNGVSAGRSKRRDPERVEETSLFLEFLLFDQVRFSTDLQTLFQQPQQKSPLGTFGIRLVERNTGLLSQLAAACFGIKWLEYLEKDHSQEQRQTTELDKLLEPYYSSAVDTQFNIHQQQKSITEELQKLEQSLLKTIDIEAAQPQWIEQVEKSCESMVDQVQKSINQHITEITSKSERQNLASEQQSIAEGVDADLHDNQDPVLLGRMMSKIKQHQLQLRKELQESEQQFNLPGIRQCLKKLTDLHQDYLQYRKAQVDTQGLKRWWLPYALVLSAGIVPACTEFLNNLSQPDKTSAWYDLYNFVQEWCNNPLLLMFFLLLCFWGLGIRLFQRYITVRVIQGQRFFDHKERGRLADTIRSCLQVSEHQQQSEHSLRTLLNRQLQQQLNNAKVNRSSAALRELGRIYQQLTVCNQQRRWLQAQLSSFIKANGLPTGDCSQPLDINTVNSARQIISPAAEFEQLQEQYPATADCFRSSQSEYPLFAGFRDNNISVLLYPFGFIEKLSQRYANVNQQPIGEEEINNFEIFVENNRSILLDVGFNWLDCNEQLSHYCTLPNSWLNNARIQTTLDHLGVTKISGEDQDQERVYFLNIMSGVEIDHLLPPGK